MIRLKKYNNDAKITKLYKQHLNKEPDDKNFIYGLYENEKLLGYVVFAVNNKKSKIEWIYAPNYGKILMQKLDRKLKNMGVEYIELNVSIDPTENLNSVMRRLNFYISLQYKVHDITFRKQHGPLLHMKKYL